MTFEFEDFHRKVCEKFKNEVPCQEVKKILNISDDYTVDKPYSTGKRLILNKIKFLGKKSTGEKIDFCHSLNQGINIWIADNLKGKSSLFKIIKLALTGSNSIKNDIKKWLHKIFLDFSITDKHYTVIIIFKNSILNGKLYSGPIDEVLKNGHQTIDSIFEVKGVKKYEESIKKFFFDQFSYYSLKWTQKDYRKDINKLYESNVSWRTYFKSIYLESKDSGELIYDKHGAQGKKIFEMLLGLELTYAINRLTIKKEKFQFDNANDSHIHRKQEPTDKLDIKDIRNKIADIEEKIAIEESKNTRKAELNKYFTKYEQLTEKIKQQKFYRLNIDYRLIELKEKSNIYKDNLDSYTRDKKKIEKRIYSLEKQKTELREYIDYRIFFSNLDIKSCPNCNHKVSEINKKIEVNEKICVLCRNPVDELHDNCIDQEYYETKIKDLNIQKQKLLQEKDAINTKIQSYQKKCRQCSNNKSDLESKISQIEDIKTLEVELGELELKINESKDSLKGNDELVRKLIEEKAVAEYRLGQLSKEKLIVEIAPYDKKINVFNFAINELKRIRFEHGKKIIKSLSDLMLKQLHQFGLKSITKIKIESDLKIQYQQDGEFIQFENITEGERLRAKIAFYLSLIQLDIKYNRGRHTRFLIIDGPGKEEGDSKYLHGLGEVLKNIESSFGKQLQILIGSAERDLAGILKKENTTVYEEGEFMF